MAPPFLRTWQSLADFKHSESSVQYQLPTIDLSGTPPQPLKIYYIFYRRLVGVVISFAWQVTHPSRLVTSYLCRLFIAPYVRVKM